MGILYSYIVKDVVDEMKLSIHPSVASSILSSIPSSIQTQQIYILKRDPKCTHFPVLLHPKPIYLGEKMYPFPPSPSTVKTKIKKVHQGAPLNPPSHNRPNINPAPYPQ
jgi:hypothetical protein